MHGNEPRLTTFRVQDLREEGFVPACDFSRSFERFFAASLFEKTEGEAAQEGHVGCALATPGYEHAHAPSVATERSALDLNKGSQIRDPRQTNQPI